MIRQIREMRALARAIKSGKTLKKDAEGRFVIDLSLDGEILSPYSVGGEPVIDSSVAEFLDHSLKHLPSNAPLHFVISGDATAEPDVCERAIRNYYHDEFLDSAAAMAKNTVLTVLMALLSASVFAVIIVLANRDSSEIAINMLDVVAWVFMWEAVDIFAFQRAEHRRRRHRARNMIESKITFQ